MSRAAHAVVALCLAIAAPVRGDDQPPPRHFPALPPAARADLAAADEARAAGEWARAGALYGRVVAADQARPGYALVEVEDGDEGRLLVGATERALQGLRALPPEGVAAFRERFDDEAAAALAAASDRAGWLRVWERYPRATCAPAALEAIVAEAWGRGAWEEALPWLRLLRSEHAAELDAAAAARLAERLEACAARSAERPPPVYPRGDAANRAASDPIPGASVLGSGGLEGVDVAALPAHEDSLLPVPHASRILPPRRLPLAVGEEVWLPGPTDVTVVAPGAEPERVALPDAAGSLEHDSWRGLGFTGVVTGGLLVLPRVERVRPAKHFRGIPVRCARPERRLVALSVADRRPAWVHRAADFAGGPLADASFGPPTAGEALLYAPAFAVTGFVDGWATCFSARTGALVWATWVGSGAVEHSMFGYPAREPDPPGVALADGTLYLLTHGGALAALDAATGRTRWVWAYPQAAVSGPLGYYPALTPPASWGGAPVVAGGVVAIAPSDGTRLQALDADDGALLWSASAAEDVLGATDDVLVGVRSPDPPGTPDRRLARLEARSPRTGAVRWAGSPAADYVRGRGWIVGEHVAVCVGPTRLFAVDLATGEAVEDRELPGSGAGHVAVGDDLLVVVGPRRLTPLVRKAD